MLIGILAIPTLLCGFTLSFKVAFQMWAFLVAFLVPGVGGTLIVHKYFWKNQRLALILQAAVIGATFLITSIVGMAMDSRTSGWRQILSFSAMTGIFVFVFVIIMSPIYSFLSRYMYKARQPRDE